MPKVSVIMPVHNSEKYLREAISSVLKQNYSDLELILVDDASTDSSVEICKQFAESDDRIVILKNDTDVHCPGAPRNVGLDHARGDYIYFMDSDDWIDPELIECAVEGIERDDADFVGFGYLFEYFYPARSTQINDVDHYGVITKQQIEDDICGYWNNRTITAWQHMFRKTAIKDCRFEHIMPHEDNCFDIDVLTNAKRISYINNLHYHYRIVIGSTYHKWNEKILDSYSIRFKHEVDFLNSLSRKPSDKEYGMIVYRTYADSIYQLCFPWCPFTLKQKKEKLEYIKNYTNVKDNRKKFRRDKSKGFNLTSLESIVAYVLIKMRLEMPLIALTSAYYKIFHKNMIRVT